MISCTSDVIAACCSGTLWLERPLKAKGPRVLPRVGRRYSDIGSGAPPGAAVAMADERSLKRFNGEGDDSGKDLRKWKAWAQAKLMTMEKMNSKQHGPWLFTLLDGSALEACEHLLLSELAIESGDKKIWRILQERFPKKEPQDQMGEVLGEVFALAAADGESAKQWTSRVRETFEKCRRKAETDFPTNARGWIVLNCPGLTDQEKAIIKAKTQGSLAFDDVSAAFRSCFPFFKATSAKSKRAIGAMPAEVEDIDPNWVISEDVDGFGDVEAFLADHSMGSSLEEVSEGEAAEALAVAWKDRRREIQNHQQARRFGHATSSNATRRSFRIEVEEPKKKDKTPKVRQSRTLGPWMSVQRLQQRSALWISWICDSSCSSWLGSAWQHRWGHRDLLCGHRASDCSALSGPSLFSRLGSDRHWMWPYADWCWDLGSHESKTPRTGQTVSPRICCREPFPIWERTRGDLSEGRANPSCHPWHRWSDWCCSDFWTSASPLGQADFGEAASLSRLQGLNSDPSQSLDSRLRPRWSPMMLVNCLWMSWSLTMHRLLQCLLRVPVPVHLPQPTTRIPG